MLLVLLASTAIATALLALRVWLVLPRGERAPRRLGRCSLAVFLGSGGHTSEARALLGAVLADARYSPRTYVYCHGDGLSLRAVAELETSGDGAFTLLALPRARGVAQPPLSSAVATARTLALATWHTLLVPLARHPTTPWADVLLVNGPGTCVVLVAVAYVRRILGLSHTRIIYVESFARVKSLSLSGRLVRPFADVFVVQWPAAAGKVEAEGGPGGAGDESDARMRVTDVSRTTWTRQLLNQTSAPPAILAINRAGQQP
ncbi:UDP-N-acetylglucosamine transferase subunit [Cryptotrichosporon argae]